MIVEESTEDRFLCGSLAVTVRKLVNCSLVYCQEYECIVNDCTSDRWILRFLLMLIDCTPLAIVVVMIQSVYPYPILFLHAYLVTATLLLFGLLCCSEPTPLCEISAKEISNRGVIELTYMPLGCDVQ